MATHPALAHVTVNVFPGGFNWPTFVALEQGLFERHGIGVTLQATPNSVSQMTGLAEGGCDIAMTAIDNIVAYVEGQGEAPIGPQPEFFAFLGSDSGFLTLVSAPDIRAVADLRGRTLSVDARTTGYAFVLFELLRHHGLAADIDYTVERAGGMTQRWNALRDGAHAATLLSTPFNLLARHRHFNELARATDVIGPYQGNIAATRRTWAKANAQTVVGFTRAFVEAIDWLYDVAHRNEAIAILRQHVEMPEEIAVESYRELLDPDRGFFRGARVNMDGLRNVLTLRSRYAAAGPALTDPAKYYDSSYYETAIP